MQNTHLQPTMFVSSKGGTRVPVARQIKFSSHGLTPVGMLGCSCVGRMRLLESVLGLKMLLLDLVYMGWRDGGMSVLAGSRGRGPVCEQSRSDKMIVGRGVVCEVEASRAGD